MDVLTLVGTLGLDTTPFEKGLEEAESQADKGGMSIGNVLKAGIAGAAITAGVAIIGIGKAALDAATEVKDANAKMQAQLGLTGEEAKALGDVAVDVFANNFGESITDVSESVTEIKKQLGDLADTKDLQGITENAYRLKDAFGMEVPESINAVKTLMTNFGLTSQEAFDFITKGMQSGLDSSGDFLDTIGEYSTQFKNNGASADEFFSLLETGLQGGVLGTDKAADSFKEFGLRIADGSESTAQALKQIGINATEVQKNIASGEMSKADYYQMVVTKLGEMNDSVARDAVGVALLGTQYEDMGASAITAIDLTKTKIGDLSGATAGLDVQYSSLGAVFEGFQRQATTALIPIGDALLQLANNVMPYVTVALSWLRDALPGIIATAMTVIQSLVDLATPAFTTIGNIVTTVTGIISGSLTENNTSFENTQKVITDVSNTINTVISTIFGAIAGFLKAHSTEIQAALTTAWEIISTVVTKYIEVLSTITLTVFGAIRTFLENNQGTIKTLFQTVWAIIQTLIQNAMIIIQNYIIPAFNLIKQFITDHYDTIMLVVNTAWTTIQSIISIALNLITGILQVALALMKGDWSGALTIMQTTATNVWNNIKTIIDTQVALVKKLISDGISAAQKVWNDTTTTIYNNTVSLWNDVQRTISEAIDKAKKAVDEKLKEINNGLLDTLWGMIDSIKDFGGRFFDAGWALIGNMYDGVMEMFDNLIQDAKDKLEELSDLLPGSEPKDPSSPLRGLAHRGAAFVGNFQDGIDSAKVSLDPMINQLNAQLPVGVTNTNNNSVVYNMPMVTSNSQTSLIDQFQFIQALG